eukprot:TRINITY_DN13879_c0_g1_i1.p1 TRINITY_DN13879_c0_g1~~TRINITY_DN13879_c0_g1_i1.p1  ORF type:complete len:489 (+),score=134.89 TRINITY_DN13879_c0_g1_i1:49-1515(+)
MENMDIADESGQTCLEVMSAFMKNLSSMDGGGEVLLFHGFRCGSAAHNLLNEGSDEDYQGVFSNKMRRLYSYKAVKDSFQVHEPHDICLYEAATYVALLFKGNPKVVEELLVTELSASHPAWKQLAALYKELINKVTYEQYRSYAGSRVGVARKSEPGSRKQVKMYAHALRLFHECDLILQGTRPDVRLTGDFRELLMSIRSGAVPQADIEDIVKTAEAELNELEARRLSSLPPAAEVLPFEDFLCRFRSDSVLAELALPTAPLYPVVARGDLGIEAPAVTAHLPRDSKLLSLSFCEASNITVGIYIPPTDTFNRHIPKVSDPANLPSCLVIKPNPATPPQVYGIQDRNYSKPLEGEVVIYEVSAAMGMLEKGNLHLFRGLYEGKMSPAWASFVELHRAAYLRKPLLVAALGQLRGLAKTASPSLSWALPFVHSLVTNATPTFTGAVSVTPEQLIDNGVPDTCTLSERFDSQPTEQWLLGARLAMLHM